MTRERADALLVLPSTLFFNARKRIIDLATEHRLPSMSPTREFATVGSLAAYRASITDLHRRSAGYVDRILKGANPADLPVEQPTKFERGRSRRARSRFHRRPLVAVLSAGTRERTLPLNAFLQGMREFGYVEGQNIDIEISFCRAMRWP